MKEKDDVLPFAKSVQFLFDCIFRALHHCCVIQDSDKMKESNHASIIDFFDLSDSSYPYRKRGLNEHISSERLAKLTWKAFENSNEFSKGTSALFLPSPLAILRDCLTISEVPHSEAYSWAACREFLFFQLKCYPSINGASAKGERLFSAVDLQASYESLNRHLEHRDTRKPTDKNISLIVLSHYLAMKGNLFLRFGTDDSKKRLSKEKTILARLKYCNERKLYHFENSYPGINPEYSLSKRYTSSIPYNEIFNELWGIPLPIRGFSTIFQGGLKTSQDGSLVVNVSGAPGTGKTSLALAIACSLSGLGTSCIYLSSEENCEDIRMRATSITPSYLKKTSLFKSDLDSWFGTQKIEISESSIDSFVTDHLKTIRDLIRDRKNSRPSPPSNTNTPAICPLIVVIDSITGLLGKEGNATDYSQLEKFISACRELGVIVLLLSGQEIHRTNKLDYLVDTVINLRLTDTSSMTAKPRRVLELLKSRQQSSRPGSHLFHLEGQNSFRISPQLSSQLDERQYLAKLLPNKEGRIHAFNIYDEKGTNQLSDVPKYEILDIYERSQILMHGVGRSGKAALGLKILAMPIIRNHRLPDRPSRVLAISFLYPENYYADKLRTLNHLRKPIYPRLDGAKTETLCFYPGYLSPEDFVNKVTRALETANLEGEPYTGVLLDGIHNVYMQFPALQESDMVWPMLYNILARANLTTVTTFTSFAVEDSVVESKKERLDAEKSRPFLHGLVQASDFFIQIENSKNSAGLKHQVIFRSALDQKTPKEEILWDSENLVLELIGKNAELDFES